MWQHSVDGNGMGSWFGLLWGARIEPEGHGSPKTGMPEFHDGARGRGGVGRRVVGWPGGFVVCFLTGFDWGRKNPVSFFCRNAHD
jgi:hypothetical protein